MRINTNVFLQEGDCIKTGTLADTGARWELWASFAENGGAPGTQVFMSEAEARDLVAQLLAELAGLDHDREADDTSPA